MVRLGKFVSKAEFTCVGPACLCIVKGGVGLVEAFYPESMVPYMQGCQDSHSLRSSC